MRRGEFSHAAVVRLAEALTVDTYGTWLPMGNTANVDRLDGAAGAAPAAPSGSKTVAAGESAAKNSSGPRRSRTCDPLIKSPIQPPPKRED